MTYTNEEYKVYLKVRHELLKEDARNQMRDYFAYERNVPPWEIDDSELEGFDYEQLASNFEIKENSDDDATYTWQCILNDYMEWMEERED